MYVSMFQRLCCVAVLTAAVWVRHSLAADTPPVSARDLLKVLQLHRLMGTTDMQRVMAESVLRATDPDAVLATSSESNRFTAAGEVVSEYWSGGVAYHRLTDLTPETGRELTARLRNGTTNGRSGIILDFRDSAGDDLGAVDAVAACLLPAGGPLYAVRRQQDNRHSVRTPVISGAMPVRVPAMVLVNERTAYGAEILAHVLKGHPGVLLVGGATRGRPAIREWVPVGSNLCVRLITQVAGPVGTNEVWTGPLAPDIVSPRGGSESVAMPEIPTKDPFDKPLSEKARSDRELMRRVRGDPVLGRAVDVLLGLKVLVQHGTGTTDSVAGAVGL